MLPDPVEIHLRKRRTTLTSHQHPIPCHDSHETARARVTVYIWIIDMLQRRTLNQYTSPIRALAKAAVRSVGVGARLDAQFLLYIYTPRDSVPASETHGI